MADIPIEMWLGCGGVILDSGSDLSNSKIYNVSQFNLKLKEILNTEV